MPFGWSRFGSRFSSPFPWLLAGDLGSRCPWLLVGALERGGGESTEWETEVVEFFDRGAYGFDVLEVLDELHHALVIWEVLFGDDVAEEDEETREGVVEDGPLSGQYLIGEYDKELAALTSARRSASCIR